VILAGLGTLCVENLNGTGASRQFKQDHTVAVQKLMFRS
jgi:hypothetical protein